MHPLRLGFSAGVALLLVTLAGMSLRLGRMPMQHSTQAVDRGTRIMPLGDSITQGNALHNSYRRPLWFKLQQAGYEVDFVGSMQTHLGGGLPPHPDFDLDHEGHWGWQVNEVQQQIAAWSREARPEIVLIHLGTNDLASGQPPVAVIAELRSLSQTLRHVNPRVRVLIAEIIPLQGSETQVQQFNLLVKQLAADISTVESPVGSVDQFSGFNVKADTYDGCHPNLSGEAKMADRWFAALKPELQR